MKVALINGVCVRYDAISNAIVAEYDHLASAFGHAAVKLFCYASDYPALNHHVVSGPAEILRDTFFRDADLIIYHFGIRYGLFNLLLIGNGRAKQLVCYHNVTPPALIPAGQQDVIAESLRQQENLHFADHVYCASEFNRDCLRAAGLSDSKLSVMGLPCVVSRTAAKLDGYAGGDILRCIFVGRMVPSKGVKDLLLALKLCLDQGRANFHLQLVGNLIFSDRAYLDELRNMLAGDPSLAERVTFAGEVDEATKQSLLRSAHVLVVPSYHEGFCVPVVEAHASGCYVVAYDNSNLPNVVGRLGRLAPTGDIQSLGRVLCELCDAWREASGHDSEAAPLVRVGTERMPFDAYRTRASEFAMRYSFAAHRAGFLRLVNSQVKQ